MHVLQSEATKAMRAVMGGPYIALIHNQGAAVCLVPQDKEVPTKVGALSRSAKAMPTATTFLDSTKKTRTGSSGFILWRPSRVTKPSTQSLEGCRPPVQWHVNWKSPASGSLQFARRPLQPPTCS